MTYRTLLSHGIEQLESCSIPDSSVDAWLLLSFVTKKSKALLLMDMEEEVQDEVASEYLDCISKRAANYPLQYITHEQCFYGYDFYVDERVLIPRYDTEILEEQLLKVLKSGMSILDMCTGSGCILLTAMKKIVGVTGTGVDISPGALEVAGLNAKRLDVEPRFIQSDIYEALPEKEKYDVITSNPPYIRSTVVPELMQEVKGFEPGIALDGGEDGLIFYRKITEGAVCRLKTSGYLIYEIGYDQGQDVADIMLQHGFSDVKVIKDLAGLDRVVMGQYKRK